MHVNNDFQRNSNISHVFDAVWRNSDISRIDISRKLNLYRSTVSNIISTLSENDIICEGERGNVTEKGGRKPVFLSIKEEFGCVIGIELQADTFSATALTFNKNSLFEFSDITPLKKELLEKPEELFVSIIDSIIEKIYPKIQQLTIPVLGICIGIPGIVDIDNGIIKLSDPFSLKDFDYGKILGKRYGLPLLIENDAKCCSWLQRAKLEHTENSDFLCVLARKYDGNKLYNFPHDYRKGIGIGLSIVLNGRIINGHNYAAGEYISNSWRETKTGQTGLPEAVLSTITTVEDSYREWLIDLFSTLTTTVSLLQPCAIYFHGQPAVQKDIIFDVLKNNVSQFDAILKRFDSKLIIMEEDSFEISKGAAMMFIQKLIEIPIIETSKSYSKISWDEIFEIQKQAKEKLLLKIAE